MELLNDPSNIIIITNTEDTRTSDYIFLDFVQITNNEWDTIELHYYDELSINPNFIKRSDSVKIDIVDLSNIDIEKRKEIEKILEEIKLLQYEFEENAPINSLKQNMLEKIWYEWRKSRKYPQTTKSKRNYLWTKQGLSKNNLKI